MAEATPVKRRAPREESTFPKQFETTPGGTTQREGTRGTGDQQRNVKQRLEDTPGGTHKAMHETCDAFGCSRKTRCRACTLRSTMNDANARNKKPRKDTKNQKRIEEVTGKVAAALPGDPKDRKLAIKQRSKLLQGHSAAKRRAEYQSVCKVELRQAERLQQSAARDLQRGDEEGAKESTDTAMRVLEMAAKQKNCAQANFDLYTIYKNGTDGVQPDLEKASQYLDAAAKSNFAEALLVKAQALEDAGDWKGAFAIYSDIAKNGCRCCTTVKCGHDQPVIAAQSKLVEMNEREALDLPPDGNMLEWIQKAAEAGDKKAKLRLAVALECGHFGLAKDLRGALKIHLELAAGDIPLCGYTGKPEISWDYGRYGFGR